MNLLHYSCITSWWRTTPISYIVENVSNFFDLMETLYILVPYQFIICINVEERREQEQSIFLPSNATKLDHSGMIPAPSTRCEDSLTLRHCTRWPITWRLPLTILKPARGILALMALTFRECYSDMSDEMCLTFQLAYQRSIPGKSGPLRQGCPLQALEWSKGGSK